MAITPTSTLAPAGFSCDLPEVQAADASSVVSTAAVARIRRMGALPEDVRRGRRRYGAVTRPAHVTAIFVAITQRERAELPSVRTPWSRSVGDRCPGDRYVRVEQADHQSCRVPS